MSDYIKREDAEYLLREKAEKYNKHGCNYALSIVLGDITIVNSISAANVRENINAKYCISNPLDIFEIWKCDNCGNPEDRDPEWNFCPICGASLKGEADG